MNAVKRCLALIAATVVIGACGGDPTADLAGTGLKIRATPGTVWMYHSKPTTVLIEAVDATGAPQPGSWTASPTGPLSVVFDSTFQPTNTGTLRISSRFVISASTEGNGFVVFSGTGGADTVNVRVAPDTDNVQLTASDSSPALFQPITLTAPAGLVFTGGTTVRFYRGPLPIDSANGGLSFPSITAWSADSTQITFVPGPGSNKYPSGGFARITGIASRQTPTLTTTARTAFKFDTLPTVDTVNFPLSVKFASTGNATTTSFLDTMVIIAPAGYVFSSSQAVEVFRTGATTATATNPDGYLVSNGQSALKVLGVTGDTVLRVLVAPGARGRFKVKNIVFANDTAGLRDKGIRFMVRSSTAIDLRTSIDTAGTTANGLNIAFSDSVSVPEGDTVTATAPAGLVFIPGKGVVSIQATSAGTFSGGDSARITGFGGDSTTVKFILPPGASGRFRYSLMARRADPEITFASRSAGTISAAAAPAVVAAITPATTNMNDTVTVALDPLGPYRFRPTSQAIVATFPSIVLSISADSLTMKALAPPGQSANPVLTNIRYANLPNFQVQATAAATVTVNAATSLGPDPIDSAATINAPKAVGGVKGVWDQQTMTSDDPSPDFDGGAQAQFLIVHVDSAGTYSVSVNWTSGTDMDIGLMKKDGTYDDAGGGDYVNVTGLSSARPEVTTAALDPGDYVLALIDFRGNSVTTGALSIKITRTK